MDEGEGGEAMPFKPEELVCSKCSNIYAQGSSLCKEHGKEYIDYKCKFCCSVASWFCWNTTHFCDSCHTKQNAGAALPRKKEHELLQCGGEPDSCPLKIKHPPNGR